MCKEKLFVCPEVHFLQEREQILGSFPLFSSFQNNEFGSQAASKAYRWVCWSFFNPIMNSSMPSSKVISPSFFTLTQKRNFSLLNLSKSFLMLSRACYHFLFVFLWIRSSLMAFRTALNIMPQAVFLKLQGAFIWILWEAAVGRGAEFLLKCMFWFTGSGMGWDSASSQAPSGANAAAPRNTLWVAKGYGECMGNFIHSVRSADSD